MPHETDQSPAHARATLRWWNLSEGFDIERRRRIWTAVVAVALALMITVAATSLWNYYGMSLPVPSPTSDITAVSNPSSAWPVGRPTATTQWEFDAGQPLSAPATAAEDAIYVISGATPDTGTIASLNASDGSALWTVRLDSIADYSPVAAGDMVFVGTRAGDLVALGRKTGATVWTTNLESSVVGPPIVHAGVIYIASRSVYAIDAVTGRQLWRHKVGGDVSRPLRLSNGIISAISSDGNVNLISASNGRRRLTFPLWFSTSAAPAVSGTTLVIPGDRAFVQALDSSQRDIPMQKAVRYWWTKLWLWDMAPHPPLPRGYLWQNRALEGDTAYALAVDDDTVFIGVAKSDQTGSIAALDLDSGDALWEVQTSAPVLAPSTLTQESLIVGIERTGVMAFDKFTGAVLWELPVHEGLSTASTLTGSGVLLAPSAKGPLKAIR